MSIGRRIEALEKSYAAASGVVSPAGSEAARGLRLDRYVKALENLTGAEEGLGPLPYTEEDRREDEEFLMQTIPPTELF